MRCEFFFLHDAGVLRSLDLPKDPKILKIFPFSFSVLIPNVCSSSEAVDCGEGGLCDCPLPTALVK